MALQEHRVPVEVTLRVARSGEVTPTSIVWSDGRVFTVLHTLGRPLRAQDPETGELGWCYAVVIPAPPHGTITKQRRLYRFGPRWYVYCRGEHG